MNLVIIEKERKARRMRAHRQAALAAAAVMVAVCGVVLLVVMQRGDTRVNALAQKSSRKWVPSLGFFVKRRAPHSKHKASTASSSASSTADARQQAVTLNTLLANTSRAHQQRFLKNMKAEAAQAGDGVGLEAEQQLSAMLASRQRKRLHMLTAAKQAPLKYSDKWTQSPNFNTKVCATA